MSSASGRWGAGIAAASCFALSACTMIPKYKRPGSPVASTFPGEAAGSGLASDIGWRAFFTDAQLRALVELSLANNRDLRVAALNVEYYQAEYRIQRAELLPTINGTASYTRSRSVLYNGTQYAPATTSQYSVTVSNTAYEIDFFGRLRSLTKQALETYLATEETRRSVAISLVASVGAQYVAVRADEEQLALSQQTLAAVRASYDLVKMQFDQGTTSALNLATSDSQVQTAIGNVLEYERMRAQAVDYLSLLVGVPLASNLSPGRPLSSEGTLADLPAGLPADLIARRPDILSAEHTLLADNANIGAARAAFFPSVTLTASGGFASSQLSTLFSQGSGLWSFAPQINVPIFAGGANIATLDAAKVTKRTQIATYEKTIQTAFREVADALVARRLYAQELDVQKALVAADQRFYDLSMMAYREGEETYLTVLIAQQDLYTAESNLITLRSNLLSNLITLYKALGGGWK
jgi:multidrug efflux system outer membrane protein